MRLNRVWLNRASPSVAATVTVLAGCALRLGGPGPRALTVLALDSPAPADSLGAAIRYARADLAILAGVPVTGGHGSPGALVGPAPTSDTVATVKATDGAASRVLHAHYRLDHGRSLDAILVRLAPESGARPAAAALLAYVGRTVASGSPVVLAVMGDVAAADSVVGFLDPAFAGTRSCGGADPAKQRAASDVTGRSRVSAAGPARGRDVLRLLYGPPVRVRCESASPRGTNGVVAHLTLFP